jgi:hypothetical protein
MRVALSKAKYIRCVNKYFSAAYKYMHEKSIKKPDGCTSF